MVLYHPHSSWHNTSATIKPHYNLPVSCDNESDSDIAMSDNIPDIFKAPTTPHRTQSAPLKDDSAGSISAETRARLTASSAKWTPKSKDYGTSQDHHSGGSAQAIDKERNRLAFDTWNNNHKAFDLPEGTSLGGAIDKFMKLFVPSNARRLTCTGELETDLKNLSWKIPQRGLESGTYSPIIKFLMKCQEGFPADKKINFIDTSATKLKGPTRSDHKMGPDILAPYPGLPCESLTWDMASTSLEIKMTKDPVDLTSPKLKPTDDNVGIIAQIVKNARNLLFFSSSCYVFVIGVYPPSQRMRIYRFDHSGSVSCGFNYVQKPHIMHDFLWRLVNPLHNIANTVVGWDPTIRIPADEKVQQMQQVVKQFGYMHTLDRRDCRLVQVRLDRAAFRAQACKTDTPSSGGSAPSSSSQATSSEPSAEKESSDNREYDDLEGFTFGPPLYKSSGLVSRATYVTRIVVNVPDEGKDRYYQFVLKDAWHQRLREPESAFYKRIQDRFGELKSQADFDWVRKILPDIDKHPGVIPGVAEYYGYLDLSAMGSSSEADDRGHSTVTRRLVTGEISSEQTRGRAITGPVGKPIYDFSSTKDVVTAIRDAIIGHFIAVSCGVLHRDISVGNILTVNSSGDIQGFLHDFDFASFPLNERLDLTESETRLKDLKTMTGTPQFMAIDVLDENEHKGHHDLESFYWVLLWLILRYTDHNHKDGKEACTKTFDHSDPSLARSVKYTWMTHRNTKDLIVKGNGRLSTLLAAFRKIFRTYHVEAEALPPTHQVIVELLDEQLNMSDWPLLPDYKRYELDGPADAFTHPTAPSAIPSNSRQGQSQPGTRRSSRLAHKSSGASNAPPEPQDTENIVSVIASVHLQDGESESSLSDLPDSSNSSLSALPESPLKKPTDSDNNLQLFQDRPEVLTTSQTSQSVKRQLFDDDEISRKKHRTSGPSGSDKL